MSSAGAAAIDLPDDDGSKRYVCIFDFEPSKIDWPFPKAPPLALSVGQVVEVTPAEDQEGADLPETASGWVFGRLLGSKSKKGYFPLSYTAPLAEYLHLLQDYEGDLNKLPQPRAATASDDGPPEGPDEATRAPKPALLDRMVERQGTSDEGAKLPPLSILVPPVPTSQSPGKSQMLRTLMEGIRKQVSQESMGESPRSAVLDQLTAYGVMPPDHEPVTENLHVQTQKVQELLNKNFPVSWQPACLKPLSTINDLIANQTRMGFQALKEKDRTGVAGAKRSDAAEVLLAGSGALTLAGGRQRMTAPYQTDMRVRSTSVRMARGIIPAMTRDAIKKAGMLGARWTPMFRQSLHDAVNETFRMGMDPSILSEAYLFDPQSRGRFWSIHANDVGGDFWFSLLRTKRHIFYMTLDFQDITMIHPEAWLYPETQTHVVPQLLPSQASRSTKEAMEAKPLLLPDRVLLESFVDPLHGWLKQHPVNTDESMQDSPFAYYIRNRQLPPPTEKTVIEGVQIITEKLPQWAKITEKHTSVSAPPIEAAEEAEVPAAASVEEAVVEGEAEEAPPAVDDAGMGDDSQWRDVKTLPKDRVEPDMLRLGTVATTLKGYLALRIFLRNRASPDLGRGMCLPYTPKMVKAMAVQLGLGLLGTVKSTAYGSRSSAAVAGAAEAPSAASGVPRMPVYHYYWFAAFALRYPLPTDWDLVVINEVRHYVYLPTGHTQLLHPLLPSLKEMLSDLIENEIMWDHRGSLKVACNECGVHDAVVWCQQCTDYFCSTCFLNVHGHSKRGKKHTPTPIPGCRYLTEYEIDRLGPYIPLVDVGSYNRARFLSRDASADKESCNCQWLSFPAEVFGVMLQSLPPSNFILKHASPPRLPTGAKHFYYHFGHDVVTDDVNIISRDFAEHRMLLKLQKAMRGYLSRKTIRRRHAAATTIQSTWKMVQCRKLFGKDGGVGRVIYRWYRRWRARYHQRRLARAVTKFQARLRGWFHRRDLQHHSAAARQIQAGRDMT
ncbi:unnamed protein product [Vitrella brassicaformis CCMP3155]|uniref:B box-type domain-containing protein n=2 Tax=Vitrella brassicaformis TaxID=1169539 RepID=A0A0G4GAJ2_VITBC|nr:unnamed protein product [Vitrella brassicaformis CCMP3155]|eukprot:CEM25744.1 unnamed protein product [Vitrella brassicaformis CCMP3155]